MMKAISAKFKPGKDKLTSSKEMLEIRKRNKIPILMQWE